MIARYKSIYACFICVVLISLSIYTNSKDINTNKLLSTYEIKSAEILSKFYDTKCNCFNIDISKINDFIGETNIQENNLVIEIKKFMEVLSETTRGEFYSIIYGSWVTSDNSINSDIDIMIVSDDSTYLQCSDSIKPLITKFIYKIHTNLGYKIDDEVPGRIKHYVSFSELTFASKAIPFYMCIESNVPALYPLRVFLDRQNTKSSQRFSSYFLNSSYLKHRLLFNILTTSNIIIGSQADTSDIWKLKKIAEITIFKLLAESGVEPDMALSFLFSNGNDTGEMNLGYKKERRGVVRYLENILTNYPSYYKSHEL